MVISLRDINIPNPFGGLGDRIRHLWPQSESTTASERAEENQPVAIDSIVRASERRIVAQVLEDYHRPEKAKLPDNNFYTTDWKITREGSSLYRITISNPNNDLPDGDPSRITLIVKKYFDDKTPMKAFRSVGLTGVWDAKSTYDIDPLPVANAKEPKEVTLLRKDVKPGKSLADADIEYAEFIANVFFAKYGVPYAGRRLPEGVITSFYSEGAKK